MSDHRDSPSGPKNQMTGSIHSLCYSSWIDPAMPLDNALPDALVFDTLAPVRVTVPINEALNIPSHMVLIGETLNVYLESGVKSNALNVCRPGVSDLS